jgi:predicted nucleic acid-binding protein
MKYVLDSCVALKWVLREPDSAKALRLRAAFQAGRHDFLAPDIFPAEVGHGLTKAERRKVIAVGQAAIHLADILATPPRFLPYSPLLGRAISISSAFNHGSYDCLYVALAEREACQLITADDKLVKNLQGQFPFILALASMP